MKKFKIIALILVVGLVLLQLFMFNNNVIKESTKPTVSVSTFALYDITKHIASDSVDIVNILPFGVDPHSFEPTPKLMAAIERSSLVVYSGAGLEPWVETIVFKNRVINMSEHVKLRDLGDDEFEFHKHHDEQCAHNKLDPHYWLDIENMKLLTQKITLELVKLQPEDEAYFLSNAASYMNGLTLLEAEYERGFKECAVREVVLQHNILGYVAPRYKFHVSSLSGLSPDALTNAKKMAELSKMIKKRGIDVLFFESFVSDRMINALAQENGVKVDYLEPLANITARQAKVQMSYVDGMRSNLEKLTNAMRCQ